MPNKTFYIADTDLPLLDQAQQVTGANISVTIVKALQKLVQEQHTKEGGFEDIVVRVGSHAPFQKKQFKGKLLAAHKVRRDPAGTAVHSVVVYQTPKGYFAVRTKDTIDWTRLSNRSEQDWENWGWSQYEQERELALDIYPTLEELQPNIPVELYDAVLNVLNGDDIEILDV
ncbi:EXLDI protein [Dictyobacter kobayashii]|nr:EXLDI protein [Dictyobacter kobayashii]